MRPSQTFHVMEDLRTTFAGPLYRKGVELSLNDNQTVIEVYQQWLLLMLDLDYLHPDTLLRDSHRLMSDMTKRDVLDLNNAFAELLHLVRCQEIKGFKALCRDISSHLYSFVKDDIELISQGDVYAAKRLVQLFSYTSRLTLRDVDLTQQCLDDYMEIEHKLDELEQSHTSPFLLDSLNDIIKKWLLPFDSTQIHFKHGPGGVSGHGRCSHDTKYKDLGSDELLSYCFGTPWWVQSPIPSNLDRISSTIFVPKSYKTFRTISMEPATLQYVQQGVLKEIDRVVRSSRWLRSHIGFNDQTRNQRMSEEGSIYRNLATIDLSAASDSVSYSLVKRLFRGTKLLRYLVGTRSKKTLLPDGRLITLKKFAPMGSALCFPVETIIFAAISEYVAREHGVKEQYSVFGDDIIIPTQCASDLMLILETLGFSVNKTKSFYQQDCWFRESCGTEYCDGFDVTPMKVSRNYQHSDDAIKTTGLKDLANAAYEKGFNYLRAFFIRKLKFSYWTEANPLFARESKKQKSSKPVFKLKKAGRAKSIPSKVKVYYKPLYAPNGLRSDSFTNFHLKVRWNSNLQRFDCRTSSPVARYSSTDYSEEIRLRHWFESTHNRISIGDGFQAETRRPTVFLQDRWSAKPFELSDQQLFDQQISERMNPLTS